MWSAGEGASTQMASLSSSAQGCCSSSSACLSLQVGHDHVPLLRLCFANTHRNCEALVLWEGCVSWCTVILNCTVSRSLLCLFCQHVLVDICLQQKADSRYGLP